VETLEVGRAWLTSTPLVDAHHPDVVAFARDTTAGATDQHATAAALVAAVRDEVRYDPYTSMEGVGTLQASRVLAAGRGWCAGKASLLVAACRAVGLPAALGYADVRNHLSTGRLTELMGTDVFAWHGFGVIEVDGEVHKASPAFNRELCERFGVEPLTFDGTADALLHAFDGEGRRHMEYVRDRGVFTDVPVTRITETFIDLYPAMFTAAAEGGVQGTAAVDDAW
jgi:hypothetical protein